MICCRRWTIPPARSARYRLAEAMWRADTPEPSRLARFLAERHRAPETALRLASDVWTTRKDIFTADALAWAHFELGHLAEAQTFIEQALRDRQPRSRHPVSRRRHRGPHGRASRRQTVRPGGARRPAALRFGVGDRGGAALRPADHGSQEVKTPRDRACRLACAALAISTLAAAPARIAAHPLSTTAVLVIVEGGRVEVTLTMDAAALAAKLDVDQVSVAAPLLERALHLAADDASVTLHVANITIDTANNATVRLTAGVPRRIHFVAWQTPLTLGVISSTGTRGRRRDDSLDSRDEMPAAPSVSTGQA